MRFGSMADLAGAVEVSESRSRTSIALAGYAGDGLRVDLVDVLASPVEAVGEVERLTDRYGVSVWAVDPSSPAGSLLLQLSALGITTATPTARDVATACGVFLDLVRDVAVKAGRSAALKESVRGAQARRLAGGTAWDRKAAVDAGPMLAAALAVWAATNYAGLAPDAVSVGWEPRTDPAVLPPRLATQAAQIASGFPPPMPMMPGAPGRDPWARD